MRSIGRTAGESGLIDAKKLQSIDTNLYHSNSIRQKSPDSRLRCQSSAVNLGGSGGECSLSIWRNSSAVSSVTGKSATLPLSGTRATFDLRAALRLDEWSEKRPQLGKVDVFGNWVVGKELGF